MSETDPPKFHDQLINLELDFADRGGIQRFSTIKEFLDWLDEERKFWSWLTQDQNVNSARNRQPQILQHFEQYDQQFRQAITSHQNQWTEWQKNYQSILKSSKDKDEKTKQEELQNVGIRPNIVPLVGGVETC